MIIKSAEFIPGAVYPKQFPPNNLPEIAFVGRSNVGKSSIINNLLNRKRLVKTGKTPGKTREIDFFLINETFRLVDLPGFGYAKVSQDEKTKWRQYIETYLSSQRRIKAIVHVIDVRHPDSENDLIMADYLNNTQLLSYIVANKVDKLKQNEMSKSVEAITNIFGKQPILYSTFNSKGKEKLWTALSHCL